MRYKSAFTTIFGKYKFLTMPFGLAQGPAYFTALMQKVYGQFNDFCFFHVDDILVHGTSKTDHLEYLKMILQKIREAGLKLKLSKCAFFNRFMQYSGHLISGKGILSLEEKVEMILDLVPTQRCN